MKGKIKGVQTIWNKYKYVALVVLVGAALLLWPGGGAKPEKLSAAENSLSDRNIQWEMEEILSKISGVGQVQVMLTEESDGERRLAQDTELRYSGETTAPTDYSRSSETVLVDGGSGDEAVVLKTLYPTWRGALVVCQGADRGEVRLAVTEAVMALTGLPADRITVAKWQ